MLEYLFSTNFGSTYRYRYRNQKRHYLYVIVTSSESTVDNTIDAIRCRQRSRLCNSNQPPHVLYLPIVHATVSRWCTPKAVVFWSLSIDEITQNIPKLEADPASRLGRAVKLDNPPVCSELSKATSALRQGKRWIFLTSTQLTDSKQRCFTISCHFHFLLSVLIYADVVKYTM